MFYQNKYVAVVPKPSMHTDFHQNNYCKGFVCTVCSKILKTRNTLRKHSKTHTEEYRLFKCNYCEKKFGRRDTLLRHQEYTHSADSFNDCPLCEARGFKTERMFHSHLRKAHTNAENVFKCGTCGKEFTRHGKNANVYLNHLSAHKENFKTTAEKENGEDGQISSIGNCSESKTKKSLTEKAGNHQMNSIAYSEDASNYEGVSSDSNENSKLQCGEETEKQFHPCHPCGKMFATQRSLYSHCASHKKNLYKCLYCPKGFATPQNLNWHLVTHSRPKTVNKRKQKRLLSLTFRMNKDGSLRSSDNVPLTLNFHPRVLVCSRLKNAINYLIQS